ncbi:MAG: UDP-N-acetylglucosamine 2-epimerase (non-hydrolyzing) [Candidatus Kuenenia stuttgartiensis]|nr:UDP-N-acetylglucosamine 2-epimerase (non-hydrolyzing) [Candidatus Kuenenia stuttgartiensis]
MIKLLTIVSARPQIIKASAISRAIENGFKDRIRESILHTGQHYDTNMSGVFFEELGIPAPDYNLQVGSESHGAQTAKMITGIESVLVSEQFDGVVLYGDTNSTLAGVVAASKLYIPIFHVEAGLRSYNMAMPEEINRVVCDQLSSLLFAPTDTAVQNLRKEGFDTTPFRFGNGRQRMLYNSGDVMYDNSMYFAELADAKSRILDEHRLERDGYVLATIHRDNNTDNHDRLTAIFSALLHIANAFQIKIVLPLHPRTKKLLATNIAPALSAQINDSDKMVIIPPVSFLDMISLEKNAKIVMTDSGGVQKEAFFFEKPCVILRPETEWVEIVENNAGIIADADFNDIINAYESLSATKVAFPRLFGEGQAARFILGKIVSYLSE